MDDFSFKALTNELKDFQIKKIKILSGKNESFKALILFKYKEAYFTEHVMLIGRMQSIGINQARNVLKTRIQRKTESIIKLEEELYCSGQSITKREYNLDILVDFLQMQVKRMALVLNVQFEVNLFRQKEYKKIISSMINQKKSIDYMLNKTLSIYDFDIRLI